MSASRPSSRVLPHQSRGLWLALFAMLMIFIGPLISQSMPMDHHASASASAQPPAGLHMEHAGHGTGHADAGHDGTHHENISHDSAAMDHALWAKCGYCTLLFGCPALPRVVTLLAAAPPKPADFYAALTREGHARRTVFLHALSRAPPFLTLS